MVVETEVVFLDRIIHKLPVLLGVKLYSEVREKFYKNLNVEDERACLQDWTDAHRGRLCSEICDLALNEDAPFRECDSCGYEYKKNGRCNMISCQCGVKYCYLCGTKDVTEKHFCSNIKEDAENCELCKGRCHLYTGEEESVSSETVQDTTVEEIIITCAACLEEVVLNKTVWCKPEDSSSNSKADHVFCFKCIENEVRELVDGGGNIEVLGFPCIKGRGCSQILYWDKILKVLPEPLRGRVEVMVQSANLRASDIEVESCRNCGFSASLEEPKTANQVFNCPKCDAAQCRLCLRKWTKEHEGRSCEEMQNLEASHKTPADSAVHICGRCGMGYERKKRLNRITCRCGAVYCYLCCQADVTYDHFCLHRPTSGDDQQCRECGKKCRLHVGKTGSNIKDVSEVEEEALVKCLICFEEVPNNEIVWCQSKKNQSRAGADHPFCAKCVRGQAKEIVDGSGRVDLVGIPCMSGEECSNVLHWSEIRSFLTGPLKRRLETLIQNENLQATETVVERCKKCGFSAEVGKSKEEEQVFRCPECGAEHCRICYEEWTTEHKQRGCNGNEGAALRQ
ncbi:unnamed protein product [Enterobius vermicularis]|uniref:RING-type domain-containing protein n=1 Tax=Enterobius vermicularis TaxID=51028 RepID=A0A0N4UWT2_ENTVE|nr:unnamed protein product [Enterobius vermicularis]